MDDVPVSHRPYTVSQQTLAINAQFYDWDYRLRGYDLYEYPIHPEPVFTPFFNTPVVSTPPPDDGKHETLISRFIGSFSAVEPSVAPDQPNDEPDQPTLYVPSGDQHTVQLTLHPESRYEPQLMLRLLQGLKGLHHPVSFELIGTADTIVVQLSCQADDHTLFIAQLQAFFPDVLITEADDVLVEAWSAQTGETALVNFGLSDECGLQLQAYIQSSDLDPYTSLIAAMDSLRVGECAVFQVLFTPVQHPWGAELIQAVTDTDGSCIFADAPYLLKATHEKASEQLFACVVRLACHSRSEKSAKTLLQRLASTLGQFDQPTHNALLPLVNDYYPDSVHLNDVLLRLTHRTGMLLSLRELVGLVHIPSASIHSPKLPVQLARTKACPQQVLGHAIQLGTNTHAGQTQTVSLSTPQRLRHTYVIGASGTGKTSLLRNLMLQDIYAGEGIALIDPHGDLVDSILQQIPAHRLQDVILFDAGDEAYPIGFNILHAHSEAEKTLLASDLTTTFKRLSETWGDRMHTVLANGIIAILEHPDGGTLLTLRRFLTDKTFRQQYLSQIMDTEIRYFWERQYPLYTGRPEASVLTRLDTFLRQKTIRNMVAQPKSSINFSEVMDSRKILLVKLTHGAIGEENAHLLGSLIVTAIHQAALRRQSQAEVNRIPFYLYIDEFQHCVTPSMEAILSGARKYYLGLTLSHQERRQLLSQNREVASSVIANAYTHVCFRLGHEDAQTMAKGLQWFDAYDLQNLSIGQAIARVEQAKHDFNLSVPKSIVNQAGSDYTQAIINASREQYAYAKGWVEQYIQRQYRYDPEPPPSRTKTRQPTEKAESPPQEPIPKPAPIQTEKDAPEQKPKPKAKLLGRGGTEHSYLQNLIKKHAEDIGFKATVEEKVLGGSGYVDVSLTLNKLKVACEVSVSTELDYEVQNIQKCLAAGFDQVLVVGKQQRKLDKLQAKVKDVLGPEEYKKVHTLLPEGFVLHLDSLVANQKKPTKTVRGYKVKSSFKATSKAEGDAKSLAVARLIGKGMK